MRRRLLLALVLPLVGCGFKLRETPQLAFRSLFMTGDAKSALAVDLRRALTAQSDVLVITDVRQIDTAQVVLEMLQELREKVVVGVNASGQVREFQLRLRFKFRLRTPSGKELIAETELLQQRDISFSESFVLAKEAEEASLYRDMQADIIAQLLRRLAAVREL